MANWENFDMTGDSVRENLQEVYKSAYTETMPVQAEIYNEPAYADAEPAAMNLGILQSNLGNCLRIIDDEVMKGYVTKLDTLPVIEPDAELFSDLQDIHFFRISELVYQEDEFSVDKLAMVFHALSNKPCTLVLLIKSDGEKNEFYLGARPNGTNSSGTLFQMLKQSLMGFFPGSQISQYYDEDMKRDFASLDVGCISSATCVADYKQEQDSMTNKEFIQGLENFVYAMQGKCYTAVFIADNVTHDELMMKKREYEQIYTQLSPFSNMQMNFTVSDGSSTSMGSSDGKSSNVSYTKSKGTAQSETDSNTHTSGTSRTVGTTDTSTATYTNSDSFSEGKTRTEGRSDSESETTTKTKSKSKTVGFSEVAKSSQMSFSSTRGKSKSISKGRSHTDSVSNSVAKTLTHGFSSSKGHSHSDSRTDGVNDSDSVSKSIGTTTNENDAYTVGEAFNLVTSKTMTDTFGTSKGVTLNAQNMTLNLAMQKIQKHLERIEECESFGMWNFAAYFLGETAAQTETAANTYKSIVAGVDSGIERSAVNSWSDSDSIRKLLPYIKNFVQPQFVYNGFSYDEDRYIAVDPTALISTNELAIHMGLPRHSVLGLPVVEHAPFGQEVVSRKAVSDSMVDLGFVYNFGQKTDTQVKLNLNSLAMHTFVTGSTGSGKSNAVYHLLSEVRKAGIPFLVVEPAKGEYKDVFTDVRCFGTNPKLGEVLKINPFSFPKEIHILEHIDRIIEIFNVCWPMYAAMPAVLKESIEQAYISAGWDLDLSENTKVEGLFPTFDDVLRELNTTIKNSEYSDETKGNYVGALATRLKSLTNGINGRIFVSDEMDLTDLFDKSAIIDISRVGSMETKSLVMGLVVLKLQEHRMANADEMNSPLKHVTVLEEAHNLLKKTSTEQSAESSNMVGKSVEMLTNAIAEIRTYGEGFVIVDQAPNLLDTAAIRNTNTKIVLRLPESTDREITGGAMALKDKQFDELSKLPTGIAAVYQNDWQEAVLCALPKYESYNVSSGRNESAYSTIQARKNQNDELLHFLLKKNFTDTEVLNVKSMIKVSNASAKVRKDLILNLQKRNRSYEWAIADFIKKNYQLSGVFEGTGRCSNLVQLADIMKQNMEQEFENFNEQEIYLIMYYICRIEHELHPENKEIERLRLDYLKGKVL
jgi:hypothetical protein